MGDSTYTNRFYFIARFFRKSWRCVSQNLDLGLTYRCSAPEFIWIESLKSIQIEIELLSDIDIRLMIKKEIRGRICRVILRHETRILKILIKPKLPPAFSMYLDKNNFLSIIC